MSEITVEMKRAANKIALEISRKLKKQIKALALEAMRQQMRERYKYIVGEWQGGVRAKLTKTGKFVPRDEVRKFIGD
ncbi:hypothetical protein ACFL6Y_07085 [Elusimicrobiota bacterium]